MLAMPLIELIFCLFVFIIFSIISVGLVVIPATD